MHDLIRDMGREIIRLSSPIEPGKRSRLWFHEDILEVLTHNMGTENIEGIKLDSPKQVEVQWSGTAFTKMKNLRILIIRNAIFSIGPTYLPNNLSLPSSYIQLDKPFKEFQILTQINFKGYGFRHSKRSTS
ncbi:hypothetical protein L6164_029933 [Bauhinia variegata]|uniref:Uncharacterized protein n=1 Tax=Bauhinia variegata TaxID=167791 RepID=A0ACB9LB54_BAUVA|nr:hypothetical protein L6164_029933 [Bauhinia variegata]